VRPLEWIDSPDDSNPAVTATSYANQSTRAARRLSTLRVPSRPKGVAGVYDVAQDWTPIYDRPNWRVLRGDGYERQSVQERATRWSILGDADRTRRGGDDHDSEPLRYVGEHTGNVINLGAFSRQRAINASSAGNVVG